MSNAESPTLTTDLEEGHNAFIGTQDDDMTLKQNVSIVCRKGRPGAARRPPWGRKPSRATFAKRLAGPEPLEDRCLLSIGAGTADTFYGGYLTVEGIYQRLDEMAAAYPAITEFRTPDLALSPVGDLGGRNC